MIDPNFPTITIAAPVRNRQEYLPYYLSNIANQSFPKSNTNLYFLINNSTDKSEEILYKFKNEYNAQYNRIKIDKFNRPNIPEDVDIRSANIRMNYIYTHLAEMRNCILFQCKTDWLFSVDTDIMLLPDTLEQLLKSNKKCISALICNGYKYAEYHNNKTKYKIDAKQYTNIMFYASGGKIRHYRNCDEGIIEVDITGAVYLIHKDIYKKCRYGFDHQGEDIYFCREVKKMGESLWCDTSHKLAHCMDLELLEKYKNGKFTFSGKDPINEEKPINELIYSN